MTEISLVVAYARNRVIGRGNAMPWHLPGDLAHFKRSTLGKPIVMGRKTWESVGRPLPGRLNVVVSRDPQYRAEGAVLAGSLEDAIAACGDVAEICIIGGGNLYTQALPLAHRVVATEIDAEIEGDAWFPPLPEGWRETARAPQPEENGHRYAFVTYERA